MGKLKFKSYYDRRDQLVEISHHIDNLVDLHDSRKKIIILYQSTY